MEFIKRGLEFFGVTFTLLPPLPLLLLPPPLPLLLLLPLLLPLPRPLQEHQQQLPPHRRGSLVSGFLAWAFAEPFGQFGLGTFQPFLVFLLPQSLEMFSSDNFPTAFVEFPPVFVGSGVGSAFIFGIHANLWWVLASKGLGVKTLLHGLLPQLLFLSLLELFEIVILPLLPFLEIVFLSFEPDNGIPQFLGFGLQLIRIHGIDIQRLDSDGQGDPLFFFKLLLGLGHFTTGILYIGHSAVGLSCTSLARGGLFLFLGLHHGLSLLFGFLQAFPLFLSLFGLLFGFFLAEPFFLLFLLLSQFLLLFSADFLAFGLFLLQPLELFLFLGALFAPFVNIFSQLLI